MSPSRQPSYILWTVISHYGREKECTTLGTEPEFWFGRRRVCHGTDHNYRRLGRVGLFLLLFFSLPTRSVWLVVLTSAPVALAPTNRRPGVKSDRRNIHDTRCRSVGYIPQGEDKDLVRGGGSGSCYNWLITNSWWWLDSLSLCRYPILSVKRDESTSNISDRSHCLINNGSTSDTSDRSHCLISALRCLFFNVYPYFWVFSCLSIVRVTECGH